MTFIIINGEIDLSVASMMGLFFRACWRFSIKRVNRCLSQFCSPCLSVSSAACQRFLDCASGTAVARGHSGDLDHVSRVGAVMLEDRSIGDFPQWFDDLGQRALIGPLTLSLLSFWLDLCLRLWSCSIRGLGAMCRVIGNSKKVARSRCRCSASK